MHNLLFCLLQASVLNFRRCRLLPLLHRTDPALRRVRAEQAAFSPRPEAMKPLASNVIQTNEKRGGGAEKGQEMTAWQEEET